MSLALTLIAVFTAVAILAAGFMIYLSNFKAGICYFFSWMFLFASIGIPIDKFFNRVLPTIWLPLQAQRDIFFLCFGTILFSLILFNSYRLITKKIAISALMIVLAGFYAGFLRLTYHGGLENGFQTLVLHFLTFIPLLLMPAIIIDDVSDGVKLLYSFVAMNVVWMIMCVVQFVSNPSYLAIGQSRRFIGLLGNPQHSATLIATLTLICIWLILNHSTKKIKIFLMILTSINLFCLLWTASRTGMGMLIVGTIIIAYSRLKAIAILAPICLITVYFGITYLIDTIGVNVDTGRLIDTNLENTRFPAWQLLFETGMSNFWVGVGIDDLFKSENSWLYGFASFGIVMFLLLIYAGVQTIIDVFRLQLAKQYVDAKARHFYSLVIAILSVLLFAAVFEGFLVARIHNSLVIFIVFSGVGAMCLKISKNSRLYSH